MMVFLVQWWAVFVACWVLAGVLVLGLCAAAGRAVPGD